MNHAKTLILVLLALLLFSSFGGTEEAVNPFKDWRAPFNAAELDALHTALEAANLTMKDLSFEKKAADQAYILDTVKRMMDEPMYGATVADITSRRVYGAAKNPVNAFRYLQGLLDLPVTPLCIAYPGQTYAKKELIESYSGKEATQMKEALQYINRLPPELSKALVLLLWSARQAEQELTLAFSELTAEECNLMLAYLPNQATGGASKFAKVESELGAVELLKIADKVDLSKVMYAAEQMLAVVRSIADSLKNADLAALSKALPDCFRIVTPLGAVEVRGITDHVYAEDAAFIIDLGGNDTYTVPTACAIMPSKAGEQVRRRVSALIDISGNDRHVYKGGYGCGVGVGGVGILLDCAGDDEYKCGNIAIGAGILGVGIVLEDSGDDLYRGDNFTQGAALFGIGLLAEGGGNDVIRAARYSQGYGSVRGIGAISDDSGIDEYFAGGKYEHLPLLPGDYQSMSQGFGFGMRPVAAGGIGILCDAGGKDFYIGDVFAQASSYWYAAGILVDGAGNDRYITTQYSQGAGIHLAAGVLLDRGGNDHYFCKNGVGMGGAHDYAVGLLLDLAGDDFYQGSGITQGGAHTNSVAIFLDGGNGRDGYSGIGTFLQGKSSESRETAGIAVMLDMGGADTYSTGLQNGELRVSGSYGVAYDLEDEEVKK